MFGSQDLVMRSGHWIPSLMKVTGGTTGVAKARSGGYDKSVQTTVKTDLTTDCSDTTECHLRHGNLKSSSQPRTRSHPKLHRELRR